MLFYSRVPQASFSSQCKQQEFHIYWEIGRSKKMDRLDEWAAAAMRHTVCRQGGCGAWSQPLTLLAERPTEAQGTQADGATGLAGEAHAAIGTGVNSTPGFPALTWQTGRSTHTVSGGGRVRSPHCYSPSGFLNPICYSKFSRPRSVVYKLHACH